MAEHILFLTGTLAESSLRQVLAGMKKAPFTWEVRALGLKVAALMTADMILRRLPDTGSADRVLLPGRCRGDLAALSTRFGVPFERGPDELRDLPEFFGHGGGPPDLSRHDVRIFAELVDAPTMSLDEIAARAALYRADGADVIDLGCLPDTPFDHLPDAVRRLKADGHRVSVDSMRPEDLLAGGEAGADFLLSLTGETLWVADRVASVPVLIPATPGDLDSLERAARSMAERGRECILDPVLDPIHFGFTDSVVRYHDLRRRLPDAVLMMGTGNLSELTEADTAGINTLLSGIMSELHITNLLTTEVSPHCRSTVRELDLARRIMYLARREQTLPKRLHGGLATLHERKPYPYDAAEIRAAADQVRDRNFRIQVSSEGIHVYNRDGFHTADDPFALYPRLNIEDDGGHAFYLGVELGRAEIAYRLGKRYTQDQPLDWGCALPPVEEDQNCYAPAASTKQRRSGS
jgi:dihydropteroate synthase-like protein